MDIKSAFLQGMKLKRKVFIKPPVEAKANGVVWELIHAVYGLTDASRHWYDRIESELAILNVKVSKFDPALFYFVKDGALHGVLVVHVDDFLYGGTAFFYEQVIKKLFEVFVVGCAETKCMRFLGYDLVQNETNISLSLKQYVDSVVPISVSSERAKLKEAVLSKEEYADFRHILGQINWCASQVRLDIAFDNCFLSNSSCKPYIRDLLYANKTIKKLKSQGFELDFRKLKNVENLCIICYADASFGNLPSGSSQGAYIILLVDENGCANLISWQSRKLKRICNSTLSAEALAAIEAVNAGLFFRELLMEVLLVENMTLRVLTDNKSLTDTIALITVINDKRLRIDVASLRETIQLNFVEGLYWIPSALNLANPLTKQGASNNCLLDVLKHNVKFDFQSNSFIK